MLAAERATWLTLRMHTSESKKPSNCAARELLRGSTVQTHMIVPGKGGG